MDNKKSLVGTIVTAVVLLAFAALVVLVLLRKVTLESLMVPTAYQILTGTWVLLLFAVLAPLLALWDADRRGIRQFTLIGLGAAIVVSLLALIKYEHTFQIGSFQLPIDFNYIKNSAASAAAGDSIASVWRVTYASELFKLIFLAVGFVAVLGIGRPLKGRAEEDFGEFCSLILFAVLGMTIVASATELFTLILGIEMTSMSSYLLAGFRRDAVGAEASLKYFVVGAISSGLMLFGISLLYGMAGTTTLPGIAAHLTAGGSFDKLSLIPIAFLLAGLGFKISSVPFHAWAPDVYSGAPPAVAGMLAAGSKAMGFVAVFNVFLVGLVGLKTNWQLAVALIAAASMFFGNLVAIQQTNIRRMLAYSSIAQAGYLLIAVAVGTSAQDGGVWAVGGGIFHLMVNAAMKLGAFLIVGALLYAGIPDHIDGWKGLGKRAPVLAFAMTVFLLSMAGLPPLGGFASKFILFSGAIDAGTTQGLGWLVWLAVIAVVNSAISLYYYLRLLRAMYVEEGESGRINIPGATTFAVVLCAALVVLMGVYAQPFLDASFHAAQDLLHLTPVAALP